MTEVKKTKKRPTDKSLTVREFQSWIEGVEDMQGSGWCPTAEQWKKIRAKITLLTETQSTIPPVQQHGVVQHSSIPRSAFDQFDQPLTTNIVGTPNNGPAPLYNPIDLNKIPDVITGDYKSVFT